MTLANNSKIKLHSHRQHPQLENSSVNRTLVRTTLLVGEKGNHKAKKEKYKTKTNHLRTESTIKSNYSFRLVLFCCCCCCRRQFPMLYLYDDIHSCLMCMVEGNTFSHRSQSINKKNWVRVRVDHWNIVDQQPTDISNVTVESKLVIYLHIISHKSCDRDRWWSRSSLVTPMKQKPRCKSSEWEWTLDSHVDPLLIALQLFPIGSFHSFLYYNRLSSSLPVRCFNQKN